MGAPPASDGADDGEVPAEWQQTEACGQAPTCMFDTGDTVLTVLELDSYSSRISASTLQSITISRGPEDSSICKGPADKSRVDGCNVFEVFTDYANRPGGYYYAGDDANFAVWEAGDRPESKKFKFLLHPSYWYGADGGTDMSISATLDLEYDEWEEVDIGRRLVENEPSQVTITTTISLAPVRGTSTAVASTTIAAYLREYELPILGTTVALLIYAAYWLNQRVKSVGGET